MWVLLLACRGAPLPNDAGLTVSGSDGIPVFEWPGAAVESVVVYEVTESTRTTESAVGIWEITPPAPPEACDNRLVGPITWGEVPAGFTAVPLEVEPLEPTEEGFQVDLNLCRSRDESGASVIATSTIRFDVEDDGAITMRCDVSVCH